MIYNIFLLKKDPDGGFTSDVIDSGDMADGAPDLTAIIQDQPSYKYAYNPGRPETDCLVRMTVHDDANHGEAKTIAEKWFHEITDDNKEGENMLWYAVQTDPTDEWGYGSYNKDEALDMLRGMVDEYPDALIAVIENDTCIEEIRLDEEA